VLAKTHHAMVGGVSGTDLLAVIMDLSPDVARPEVAAWSPRPAPSGPQLALDAVTNLMRSPYEQLRAIQTSTRALRQALSHAREVGQGVVAMAGLVRPPPVSSLNGPIGPHRRYRLGVPLRRGHQSHQERPGRHLQRCRAGLDHQHHHAADGGTQRLQAGRGRGGAHLHVGLRPADAAGARHATSPPGPPSATSTP
jgi:hypothetical protein